MNGLTNSRTFRKGLPLTLGTSSICSFQACPVGFIGPYEAEERGHWAQVFALLAQETLWDLARVCAPGPAPSLGSWVSILDQIP